MRNNVLIILSILVLVVSQISEETASQRTQITLSFGQVNRLDLSYPQSFYFYVFSTKELDTYEDFNLLVKLIKNGTEESETQEFYCQLNEDAEDNALGDTGSTTIEYYCNVEGEFDQLK